MATTKNEAVEAVEAVKTPAEIAAEEAAYWNERVKFTAPLLEDEENADLKVAINGELIVIKRGEEVEIPRSFLKAIENSELQKINASRARTALQNALRAADN